MAPKRKRNSQESAQGDDSDNLLTWTCPLCTLENPGRRRRCAACESRRPVELKENKVPVVTSWLKRRRRKREESSSAKQQVKVTLRLDNLSDFEPLYASLPSKSLQETKQPRNEDSSNVLQGNETSIGTPSIRSSTSPAAANAPQIPLVTDCTTTETPNKGSGDHPGTIASH